MVTRLRTARRLANKPDGFRSTATDRFADDLIGAVDRRVLRVWTRRWSSAISSQRMLFRDLDENDARPIRIGDPHLHEPPRLALGRANDLDIERRKAPMLTLDVAHLQP